MSQLQDFMIENSDECIRIAYENRDGLVIRPLSSLSHSLLLNPANSKNGDLEEAVANFDTRNEGFDLTSIINSSVESRELLQRLVDRNVHIENKIIQSYGLFDVQMFGETPLFRYTLGIMPEYVDILERIDIEDRIGVSEFGGILHRGISPNFLQEAYQQKPENYTDKLWP